MPPTMDYGRFSPFNSREGEWLATPLDTDELTVGECAYPRRLATSGSTSGIVSGSMRLVYFTARKDETVTQVSVSSGTTAAGATPTLIRIGVYEVAANGDLTLVASTPNDTTLLSATNITYTKALSASLFKKKGTRYAIGLLIMTAAALPTFLGTGMGNATLTAIPPRMLGTVASLSDLPSTVASGTVAASTLAFHTFLT